MVAKTSQMPELGIPAAEFTLPDADGKLHSLGDGKKAYLVMFICNHCPFVKHVREELARLGAEYLPRGAGIFAINSNDPVTHPGDSAENMRKEIATYGYRFPYLVDASQETAKKYRAACTPDFFLFDAEKKLVYRGQLDGSRPANNVPVDGRDLRAALDAVLEGKKVSDKQVPSIGCNIKWKAGNEPDYFD
jgi:thiol-disulfide isomerase/thioredoxin